MSVVKTCLAAALSLMTLASVAEADDFKLVSNQRIACGRGLAPGKLNTATCKSFAYVFNAKTSEYARCQVTLALTRDNKEVINVQADGNCTKKQRIFDTDSSYSFDATETIPSPPSATRGSVTASSPESTQKLSGRSRRMDPAPRKPTPVTIWAAMRAGSWRPSVGLIEAMVKMVEPTQMRIRVRRPAGLS